jgi:hypothetical protein
MTVYNLSVPLGGWPFGGKLLPYKVCMQLMKFYVAPDVSISGDQDLGLHVPLSMLAGGRLDYSLSRDWF